MRRRAAAVAAGALVVAGVFALSAFRAGARAERELASPLFIQPVSLAPAIDRRLPARAGGGIRDLAGPQRVLRIGGDAGDADAAFGQVADVAPGLSGDTVYVLDEMDASVSAFDARGHHLFSFGGKGGGPGEFRRPVQLIVLPWSGEVAAWDLETQRLTVHTPAGDVVRVVTPGTGDSRGQIQRIRAFRGGYVAEVHSDPLRVNASDQRGALVRLDTAAGAPRALFSFATATVTASHQEPAPGTSITTWSRPPTWSPEPRWDLLPDGTILFAPGGPDEAYRVAPSGRVSRLHRQTRAARVTRGDRLRRLEGERDRRIIASPRAPLALLEAANRRFFAAVRPSVTGVLGGSDGALWTRGFDTRESWQGFSRTWTVTHAEGRPAGAVRLPASFEPVRVVDGVLYGVAEDEMHVQRVEAYRVEDER